MTTKAERVSLPAAAGQKEAPDALGLGVGGERLSLNEKAGSGAGASPLHTLAGLALRSLLGRQG